MGMTSEAKKETKVEAAVPKSDKKSQGTLHPNYKDDVKFRHRWRNDEGFRASWSSKYGWTEDEARGIIVRESGWVKPKPGYKPCCCGNDFADVCYILASLVALYISYAGFFAVLYVFWLYAENYALYVFFVLMGVYWLTVAILVYTGAAQIEKEKQEEERLEELRLQAEAEEKNA